MRPSFVVMPEPAFLVPSVLRTGAEPSVPPARVSPGGGAESLASWGGAMQSVDDVEAVLQLLDRLIALLNLAGYEVTELAIQIPARPTDPMPTREPVVVELLSSHVRREPGYDVTPAMLGEAGVVGLMVSPRTDFGGGLGTGSGAESAPPVAVDGEGLAAELGFAPDGAGWLLLPLGGSGATQPWPALLGSAVDAVHEHILDAVEASFADAPRDERGVPRCGLLGIYHPASWAVVEAAPESRRELWETYRPLFEAIVERIYARTLGDYELDGRRVAGVGVRALLERELAWEPVATRFPAGIPAMEADGRHSASDRIAASQPLDASLRARARQATFDELEFAEVVESLQPPGVRPIGAPPRSRPVMVSAELRVFTWTETIMRLHNAGVLDVLSYFGGEDRSAYGGYDLQRGDSDTARIYAGEERSSEAGDSLPGEGEPGFVAALRADLSTLGFGPLLAQDGTSAAARAVYGPWLECAVREFQIYARMPRLARVRTEAEALERTNPGYADTLIQTENPSPYGGPISGVCNRQTRVLIKAWVARALRCPVVVEARVVPDYRSLQTIQRRTAPIHSSQTTPQAPGPAMRTLLDGVAFHAAHDYEHARTPRNVWGREQVQWPAVAGRQFRTYVVHDFSAFFPASPGRDQRDPTPIATLGGYDGWEGGGAGFRGETSWPEAEIVPTTLLGRRPDPAQRQQQEALWSAFRVIRGVAEAEAVGYFDGLNAYDRALISAGPFHWTLGLLVGTAGRRRVDRGELSGYLALYKAREPEEYAASFGALGLQPAFEWGADGSAVFSAVHRKFFGWVKLQREDGSFADLREVQSTGALERPSSTNPRGTAADETLGETLRHWHWYHRYAAASRVLPGFRTTMWPAARERIRIILDTPWDNGATRLDPDDPESRPLLFGDVFTSELSVALVLRWWVWSPPRMSSTSDHRADHGYQHYGAAEYRSTWLTNAFRRAVNVRRRNHPSTWGDREEAALVEWLVNPLLDPPASMAPTQSNLTGLWLANLRNWPRTSSGAASFRIDLDEVCEQAPTIGEIANCEVAPGGIENFRVDIRDRERPSERLRITKASSHEARLPAAAITVNDVGGGRFSVTLQPPEDAQTGRVTVSISADDGRLITTRRFYAYVQTEGAVPADPPADAYVRPSRDGLSQRRHSFKMETGDLGPTAYPIHRPRPGWDVG